MQPMSGVSYRGTPLRRSALASTLPIATTWSRRLVGVTVLVTGGQPLGVPTLTATSALIVAGVGFVAGVPHGALDHVMAKKLTHGTNLLAIAAVYAGSAAGSWALLQFAGPIALVAVVVLSALHFGVGEVEITRGLTGWRPNRLSAASLIIAGSGALLLPVARSGDQLMGVAAALSPRLAALIGAAPLHAALMVTWFAAAALAVTAALCSGHRGVALDIVLIGALGLLAPPLVAFAMWFGCWHSLRHTARMLTVEPGCAALLSDGRPRAAISRLTRLAALPSAAALTVIAVMGWVTLGAPDPAATTRIVADVLRLLLALTVPHMMVVLWLDRAAHSHDVTNPRSTSGRAGALNRRIDQLSRKGGVVTTSTVRP
jgi:Brp/Blh family beta-carotene 15,15'-monooxygenase